MVYFMLCEFYTIKKNSFKERNSGSSRCDTWASTAVDSLPCVPTALAVSPDATRALATQCIPGCALAKRGAGPAPQPMATLGVQEAVDRISPDTQGHDHRRMLFSPLFSNSPPPHRPQEKEHSSRVVQNGCPRGRLQKQMA